jgi:hypothetical protein
MMISRPLRVACGSGHPQFRQNEVEKLRAVERSKRATLSSPDNQRNAGGKTYAFAEHALPVALRHREQWHLINLMNGRSTSNSTNPQRHPPRTDISHLLGPVSKILSARPPQLAASFLRWRCPEKCQRDYRQQTDDDDGGDCPGGYFKFLFCRVVTHSAPQFGDLFPWHARLPDNRRRSEYRRSRWRTGSGLRRWSSGDRSGFVGGIKRFLGRSSCRAGASWRRCGMPRSTSPSCQRPSTTPRNGRLRWKPCSWSPPSMTARRCSPGSR